MQFIEHSKEKYENCCITILGLYRDQFLFLSRTLFTKFFSNVEFVLNKINVSSLNSSAFHIIDTWKRIFRHFLFSFIVPTRKKLHNIIQLFKFNFCVMHNDVCSVNWCKVFFFTTFYYRRALSSFKNILMDWPHCKLLKWRANWTQSLWHFNPSKSTKLFFSSRYLKNNWTAFTKLKFPVVIVQQSYVLWKLSINFLRRHHEHLSQGLRWN